MNKKRLILLVIIIAGIWFFWGRNKAGAPVVPDSEGDKVEEAESGADHNAPQPPLTLRGGDIAEGMARVHYLAKDALGKCGTETITLEQAVDPKYGHPAAGALVVQTLAIPASAQATHVSALPAGTRLLTLRMSKEGVATVDYNAKLLEGLSDCNKVERRAQIESTLKEFSEIKGIVITVEGKVWE